MAVVQRTLNFTIASNDTFIIGDASRAFVGTYIIHFYDPDAGGTAFDGEVLVQARGFPIGGDPAVTTPEFLTVNYLPQNLGGTPTASYPTYTAAAITGTGLIHVPASGSIIALTVSSWTEGSLQVFVHPVAGAAC